MLRAVCFACGLEHTEDPLLDHDRHAACLACGETKTVIDERAIPDYSRRW